jgi:hypothetical protein
MLIWPDSYLFNEYPCLKPRALNRLGVSVNPQFIQADEVVSPIHSCVLGLGEGMEAPRKK